MSPSKILSIFVNAKGMYQDYTFIIMGRSGPTGKTWLCNQLRNHGFNAFDISENIYDKVKYQDNNNSYSPDHLDKQIVIVLNRDLQRGDEDV
jgi:hypothetical protein